MPLCGCGDCLCVCACVCDDSYAHNIHFILHTTHYMLHQYMYSIYKQREHAQLGIGTLIRQLRDNFGTVYCVCV
jgi:hypothetical protein